MLVWWGIILVKTLWGIVRSSPILLPCLISPLLYTAPLLWWVVPLLATIIITGIIILVRPTVPGYVATNSTVPAKSICGKIEWFLPATKLLLTAIVSATAVGIIAALCSPAVIILALITFTSAS